MILVQVPRSSTKTTKAEFNTNNDVNFLLITISGWTLLHSRYLYLNYC